MRIDQAIRKAGFNLWLKRPKSNVIIWVNEAGQLRYSDRADVAVKRGEAFSTPNMTYDDLVADDWVVLKVSVEVRVMYGDEETRDVPCQGSLD
jgi:hypothetical protein